MDPGDWRRYTAIARVTANGGDTVTLKLYAVEGMPVNDWLARLKKGVQQQMDDPPLGLEERESEIKQAGARCSETRSDWEVAR
jgi:hypothetical protein